MKKSNNIVFIILLVLPIIIIIGLLIHLKSSKDKYQSTYQIIPYKLINKNVKNYIIKDTCNSRLLTKKSFNGKLKAVSDRTSKAWTLDKLVKSKLRVKFLNDPDKYFPRNYTGLEKDNIDKNGNIIKWDPLEEELRDEKNIIECVKQVIIQRIQPLFPFEIEFIDIVGPILGPIDPSYIQSEIRIYFDKNGGSSSFVGIENLDIPQNENTMSFSNFNVGTVLHEFGHAIGLLHEHQSPKYPIIWNEPELIKHYIYGAKWTMDDLKINILNVNTDAKATIFDPDSVMLYFYPANFTLNDEGECCGTGTKVNKRFSPIDVAYIMTILYPGGDFKIDYVHESTILALEEYYLDSYGERPNFKKIVDYMIQNVR